MKGFVDRLKDPKTWIFLAVIGLFSIIYLTTRPAPPAVVLIRVMRSDLTSELSDYGTTYFKDVTTVLAPVTGWITQIHVQVGRMVEQGRTPLVSISASAPPLLDTRTRATLTAQWESARAQTEQLRAQLKRAQAAYQAALKSVSRTEIAFKAGAVSVEDFEALRAKTNDLQGEVRTLEAGLDAALHQRDAAWAAISKGQRDNQDERMLNAPRSGTVSWVYDEKPRFVGVGTPLLDLANPTQLGFQIDVLASEALRVEVGAPVRFNGLSTRGRVKLISPTAQAKISPLGLSEQRTRIWIDFDSTPVGRLPAGLELEAHIELARQPKALVIPRTAVWRDNQRSWVFKVENKILKKSQVELGIESRREVEVLAGLLEGDWLVQLPTEELSDGQKISPQFIAD